MMTSVLELYNVDFVIEVTMSPTLTLAIILNLLISEPPVFDDEVILSN